MANVMLPQIIRATAESAPGGQWLPASCGKPLESAVWVTQDESHLVFLLPLFPGDCRSGATSFPQMSPGPLWVPIPGCPSLAAAPALTP